MFYSRYGSLRWNASRRFWYRLRISSGVSSSSRAFAFCCHSTAALNSPSSACAQANAVRVERVLKFESSAAFFASDSADVPFLIDASFAVESRTARSE
jgi:hypothetical protein